MRRRDCVYVTRFVDCRLFQAPVPNAAPWNVQRVFSRLLREDLKRAIYFDDDGKVRCCVPIRIVLVSVRTLMIVSQMLRDPDPLAYVTERPAPPGMSRVELRRKIRSYFSLLLSGDLFTQAEQLRTRLMAPVMIAVCKTPTRCSCSLFVSVQFV